VEHITTNIRGANYFAVKNTKSFKKQMEDDFDYMVTPIVFDVRVKLETKEGFEIDAVFGSPEAIGMSGNLMTVGTLFPSAKEREDATKGGVIVIKLLPSSSSPSETPVLKIALSYETRDGEKQAEEISIEMLDKEPDYYQDDGVRKALLLTHYVNLVKNYIGRVKISEETGISNPPLTQPSIRISSGDVKQHYQPLFAKFLRYFEREMEALGDETLAKEFKVIESLGAEKPEKLQPLVPEVDPVAQLCAMGFDKTAVTEALATAHNDPQQACTLLMGKP